MNFTYKLARRLAVSRIAPLGLLAAAAACGGDAGSDQLGPDAPQDAAPSSLVISPRSSTLGINEVRRFAAFSVESPGDSMPVEVDWEASGGSISSDGSFSASQAGSYRVIGRDRRTRGPADTATVTVAASSGSPRGTLSVSPDTVTLEPTARHAFRASGATDVAWSASGGTISPTGEYVATGAPGTYHVVATDRASAAQDTAIVTVASRPSAGGGSAEPAGMRRLAERAFNAIGEDGWTTHIAERLSIVRMADAPRSGPSVGRVLYPRGFQGGKEPVVISRRVSEKVKQLYLSFWVRYSPNFVGHPSSGVNKLFHLWIGGSNRVYLSAQGRNDGSLQPQVRLQDIVSDGGFRNLQPNRDDTRMQRGRWYRWEVLVTANGNGSDGQVRWWIDGRQAGEYGGLKLVSSGNESWEQVQLAPTWGGMGERVPADQWMDLDHIYVSGS